MRECQVVELESVEREARGALAAFDDALSYTSSHFSWPRRVIKPLEDKIE